MSRTRDLIGLAEMVYTIPPGRGSAGAVCKTAPAKILTPIETVVSEEQNQHFVYFGRIFPIRGVYSSPRQRITVRSASATTATSSIATAESRTMGAKTPAPSSWVIIRREK